MDKYIEGNKEAWEEAFDKRDVKWGADITERVQNEDYPFFNEETKNVLKKINVEDSVIGHFCCNNGRELLSLVKSGKAKKGIGFDIAENQVAFANEKAKELQLPCVFEAVNIYDIDDRYREQLDVALITIGALCWFENLNRFFEAVAKCMKPGAVIVINEQHPFTNMLATEGEELFNPDYKTACYYSYFEHEWTGNGGMYYMTQKNYKSKTFTDYTHPMSEIISGMCNNGIVVTDLKEYDYDLSGGFSSLDHSGFPLSMIIQGCKVGKNAAGKNIKTKQFQILTDINLVWDFLTDIYDLENGSGVAAPFFEHAILASWMDNSYSYLNRFWFDGDKVVAFVFYEAPATDIYFSVRKGYEFLADELIEYAMTTMPTWDGKQQLVLFNGQEYLKEAAKKHGFNQVFEYEDRIFDFKNELNYDLPDGFHFVNPEDIDAVKIGKLCWYGFDHGDKGEFVNWDKQDTSFDWTPEKSYKDCLGDIMAPLPHATHEYDIIIADEKGEYVCFSGMWWVPQNKLAYMEPLCTVPDHRRKSLAAAALTAHYRRMKALGATHMTGGGDPFYEKIGYGKGLHWSFWKKDV